MGRIEKAIIVVAIPDFPLLTKESRRVLPGMIPMEHFISNMAYASMIAWAVAKKDAARFGRSIQDRVAEAARAPLIKGFEDVKGPFGRSARLLDLRRRGLDLCGHR